MDILFTEIFHHVLLMYYVVYRWAVIIIVGVATQVEVWLAEA